MKPDPTIDKIKKTRHEISKEFDHDPEKLVKYYMEYQKKYRNLIGSTRSVADFVPKKNPEETTT